MDVISPIGVITEHLEGAVQYSFSDVGWTFGLSGTTQSRTFSIAEAGTWSGPGAASGPWQFSGAIGTEAILGSGTLNLDSPLWTMGIIR